MVIGAEREPELETGNGHTSCIMWSTCTCGSCLDLRDEHRVSLLREKLFMDVSSMWVCVVGVWLHHHKVLIIHFLYIQHHLLSEIKYSYCSHDADSTGVRISFVPRHSQFSWSPSIWTPSIRPPPARELVHPYPKAPPQNLTTVHLEHNTLAGRNISSC